MTNVVVAALVPPIDIVNPVLKFVPVRVIVSPPAGFAPVREPAYARDEIIGGLSIACQLLVLVLYCSKVPRSVLNLSCPLRQLLLPPD